MEITSTPLACAPSAQAAPIELQIGDAVLHLRVPIELLALRQVLQCLRDVQAGSSS